MDVLICVACLSGAGPQLSFGNILGSIGRGVTLTLIHVLPQGGDRKAARRCLAEAREKLERGAAESKIRLGDPAGEILTEIEEGNHDLVILGPNEAPGLKRHLLGSVTRQIVRRAPASVLVAQQTKPRLEHVLVCSGGAEMAERVIESGARLAQAAGAQATLLHVVTPVASMYAGLHEIDESLTELLQTDTPVARHLRHGAEILDRHQVSAELRLRYGVVADEIIRESDEGDYDLVLIGAAEDMARFRRLVLGEVTRQVVERSSRSVLVVRGALSL